MERPRLHSAAVRGDVALVERLLAKGVSVDSRWTGGWTPLHLAADEGQAEAVDLLLRSGADPRAVDEEFLQSAIHLAAYRGHSEVVRLLCDAGVDAGRVDADGRTPLHMAAAGGEGTLTTARYLIDRGSDLNAADLDGETPIMSAALSSNLSVANLLIERGADVSPTAKHGDDAAAVARRQYAALCTGRGGAVPARHQAQARVVRDVLRLLKGSWGREEVVDRGIDGA